MTTRQPERNLSEWGIVGLVVLTVFGAALLVGQDQPSWQTPAPVQSTSTLLPGPHSPQTPTPTRPSDAKPAGAPGNPAGARSPITPAPVSPQGPATPTPTAQPSATPQPTVVG
jgi:hypothetical protein